MYPVFEIMPFTYPYPRLAHSPSGAKNLDEWTESRESRYGTDIPTFPGNLDGGEAGGAQVDLPSMKQMERQVYPSMQHCNWLPDLLSPPKSVCERVQALSIRRKHYSDIGSLGYRGVFKDILKSISEWTWGCSSVSEALSNLCKAMGVTPTQF